MECVLIENKKDRGYFPLSFCYAKKFPIRHWM
nr:MAG TPA: hypothetical protein [Caudoviricetes sp.]